MDAIELMSRLPARAFCDKRVIEDTADLIVVAGDDDAAMDSHLLAAVPNGSRVVPGRITWKHIAAGGYSKFRAAALEVLNPQ